MTTDNATPAAQVQRIVGKVLPPPSKSDKQAGWIVEFDFCDRLRYEIRKTVGLEVTTKDCEDILLIIDKLITAEDK